MTVRQKLGAILESKVVQKFGNFLKKFWGKKQAKYSQSIVYCSTRDTFLREVNIMTLYINIVNGYVRKLQTDTLCIGCIMIVPEIFYRNFLHSQTIEGQTECNCEGQVS